MEVNTEERKKWDIKPGNTVRVWQKIKEGEKTRLQAFEGMIIAHKHGFEPGATFTVRKISSGIGVERTFPVFSPNVEKIEIVKRAKVRRSKLYYIRDKAAKQIRKKMKQIKASVTKEAVPGEKEPAQPAPEAEKAEEKPKEKEKETQKD